MSNESSVSKAFNALMAIAEGHDNVDIGKAILAMENAPARLLIDDAPGIIGNHQDAVHKAILHLHFLYEDIMRYPPMGADNLMSYIDSQYGVLHGNLIAAFKPNGEVSPEVATEFTQRGYMASPNVRDNTVMLRVGHSCIKI